MDRRIRDVVDWWKSLGDFSFFDMIDFFKGSDGGPSVFGFGGGIDGIGGVKDGGIGNSIFVGSARGRMVEAVMYRHDREFEVREEGGGLVKVCKAS